MKGRKGGSINQQVAAVTDRNLRGRETEHEEDVAFDMNQDSPGFVPGERVMHETFGAGAVMEISGFGRDLKVKVNFDDVGEKKLLLRYARLEKDWP